MLTRGWQDPRTPRTPSYYAYEGWSAQLVDDCRWVLLYNAILIWGILPNFSGGNSPRATITLGRITLYLVVDDDDVDCNGVQSFAESSAQRKTAADSRLNSDDGGITSSDCETRTRSRSAAARRLHQRRTIDVVDADLISYRPFQELRPPGPAQSEAAGTGEVPAGIAVEAARPTSDGVEQQRSPRRERDIRELRRRLRCQRAQRKCDDEPPQSSGDRDTVEVRLDQLARSSTEYNNDNNDNSNNNNNVRLFDWRHNGSAKLLPHTAHSGW